jgi:hypothetical protein
MSDLWPELPCQRCGTSMDLRDPPPGSPYQPVQFWVCARCGRHFWTTYPQPKDKPAPEASTTSA